MSLTKRKRLFIRFFCPLVIFSSQQTCSFAGWPEDSVYVEEKTVTPLHNGESYSQVDGGGTYKLEFRSMTKNIELQGEGEAQSPWRESIAVVKGYYYSKKGKPIINFSLRCSFLSNGSIVKLNPLNGIEHEEVSLRKRKKKVTGWSAVRSSPTQEVVAFQINSWKSKMGLGSKFKKMDAKHVNVECDLNGKIRFYILAGRFF